MAPQAPLGLWLLQPLWHLWLEGSYSMSGECRLMIMSRLLGGYATEQVKLCIFVQLHKDNHVYELEKSRWEILEELSRARENFAQNLNVSQLI